MENASKAIIMAGGVLIAVSLISLAIYAYSYFKDYANVSEQMLSISQIESFNRYYDSFESTIRGIDALNIYNKALEDINDGYQIDIVLQGTVASEIINQTDEELLSQKFLKEYNYSVDYDSSGRVNKITLG